MPDFHQPLELREYPLPDEIEPGAALVKVEMAGICGTDVHLWKGQLPIPRPIVMGHETVGVIERLGAALETDWTGEPLGDAARRLTLLQKDVDDWNITFVDTGMHANLGQRLLRVRHLKSELERALTYLNEIEQDEARYGPWRAQLVAPPCDQRNAPDRHEGEEPEQPAQLREPQAGVAGPCRLNRRVERQQVRLVGNLRDRGDDLAENLVDFFRLPREDFHLDPWIED